MKTMRKGVGEVKERVDGQEGLASGKGGPKKGWQNTLGRLVAVHQKERVVPK